MKTKSFLKICPALLIIVLFIGISCDSNVGTEETAVTQQSKVEALNILSGGTVTLFAGQHMDVGEVEVADDGSDLTVTFRTTGEWCLLETHVDVWETEDEMPVNKNGNPVPGQFDYSDTHECEVETSYTIPLSNFSGADLLIAAHAVVSNQPSDPGALLYGTQRSNQPNNGLFSIDIASGDETLLFTPSTDAGIDQNSPNALGYDPENERLYYMKYSGNSGPSTLYFHELGSGIESAAGLAVDQLVVGASFYNGAYYYIPNLTADLFKLTLNGDGSANVNAIACPDFNGESPAVYRYGDFAINGDGMLYSSSNGTSGSTAEFFSLDVNSCTYNLIADENVTDAALGLQVSFGADGTLYAHNAGSGDFFSVDLGTGVVTLVKNLGMYSDLASGAIFVLQEETAWGAGSRFVEQGNWGTYFEYTIVD